MGLVSFWTAMSRTHADLGSGESISQGDLVLIFLSYNRENKEAIKQFLRFLNPLQRNGSIEKWDDSQLRGGDDWAAEIDKALGRATAAVVFVSQDTFDSTFVSQEELPRIVAGAEADQLTLIPVFLSPSLVDILEIPFTDHRSGKKRSVVLTKYQGYGTTTSPLSTWDEREHAYNRSRKSDPSSLEFFLGVWRIFAPGFSESDVVLHDTRIEIRRVGANEVSFRFYGSFEKGCWNQHVQNGFLENGHIRAPVIDDGICKPAPMTDTLLIERDQVGGRAAIRCRVFSEKALATPTFGLA